MDAFKKPFPYLSLVYEAKHHKKTIETLMLLALPYSPLCNSFLSQPLKCSGQKTGGFLKWPLSPLTDKNV